MKSSKRSITKYKKQDVSMTIIMWASYCSIMNNAYESLKKELKYKYNINLNLNIYSTRDISDKLDEFLNDAKKSDIVFMYRTSSDEFYDNIELNFKNLVITGQDPTYWNSKLSSKAYLYTAYGGIENFKNLILYLVRVKYNLSHKF